MDMERLLLDREGLEMELEDMATHEEVDSFGSEVGNHQSQMVVVQRSLRQILAEPSFLLRSFCYDQNSFYQCPFQWVGAQCTLTGLLG